VGRTGGRRIRRQGEIQGSVALIFLSLRLWRCPRAGQGSMWLRSSAGTSIVRWYCYYCEGVFGIWSQFFVYLINHSEFQYFPFFKAQTECPYLELHALLRVSFQGMVEVSRPYNFVTLLGYRHSQFLRVVCCNFYSAMHILYKQIQDTEAHLFPLSIQQKALGDGK
jgi:hypothetical protein